mgnify:CR=1 FL=1
MDRTFGAAKDAGNLTEDRLSEKERRQLASGDDEVTARELRIDTLIDKSLIDPAETTANENESLIDLTKAASLLMVPA